MGFLYFLTPIYPPDFPIFAVCCPIFAIGEYVSLDHPDELLTPTIYEEESSTRLYDHIAIYHMEHHICIAEIAREAYETISVYRISDTSDEELWLLLYCTDDDDIIIEGYSRCDSIERCIDSGLSHLLWYERSR